MILSTFSSWLAVTNIPLALSPNAPYRAFEIISIICTTSGTHTHVRTRTHIHPRTTVKRLINNLRPATKTGSTHVPYRWKLLMLLMLPLPQRGVCRNTKSVVHHITHHVHSPRGWGGGQLRRMAQEWDGPRLCATVRLVLGERGKGVRRFMCVTPTHLTHIHTYTWCLYAHAYLRERESEFVLQPLLRSHNGILLLSPTLVSPWLLRHYSPRGNTWSSNLHGNTDGTQDLPPLPKSNIPMLAHNNLSLNLMKVSVRACMNSYSPK